MTIVFDACHISRKESIEYNWLVDVIETIP
jgi:hypothetical protein